VTVKCYRAAFASRGNPLPTRSLGADGSPIADPLAAALSHQVACVVHDALVKVASNLRWALHGEPEPPNEHPEPVGPVPA
jgi:hypothetical protein